MNGKPRLAMGRLRPCPGFSQSRKQQMGELPFWYEGAPLRLGDCGMRGIHDSPHLAHLSENLGYAPRFTLHPVIAPF